MILALGSVETDPGTKIHGNIVFDKVRSPECLKGRVRWDEKIYSGRTTPTDTSGAFLDYYFVTLAPRPVYRSIERN